jgi:hypothetical protein
MKKIKITGLIISLIMIFHGCEQLPDPAGLRGVAVVPGITDVNPAVFDSKDLENSYVEFTVIVAPGTQPDLITVAGSFNNNRERVSLMELTSFPATIKVYSSDVAEKLGLALNDIVNGDVFTLELLTKANGITTGSSAVLLVPVACAYDVNMATGSYHSVSTDWQSEGDITLTADESDPYKIYVSGLEEIEGLIEDQGPFVMNINPINYSVTAPEKVISSDFFGYGPVSYSGYGGYSTCDGSYIMYFDISVGVYGSQGVFTFTFTRNP